MSVIGQILVSQRDQLARVQILLVRMLVRQTLEALRRREKQFQGTKS